MYKFTCFPQDLYRIENNYIVLTASRISRRIAYQNGMHKLRIYVSRVFSMPAHGHLENRQALQEGK